MTKEAKAKVELWATTEKAMADAETNNE